MSCTHCRGNSVNWNEQFSIFALCYECDSQPIPNSPKNVTYNWKLYLVNASSKVITDGKILSFNIFFVLLVICNKYSVYHAHSLSLPAPFFSIVDLGLPAKIEEHSHLYQEPTVTPYTEVPFTQPPIPESLSPYLVSNNTDVSSYVTQSILTSEIYTKPHIKAHTPSPNTDMLKHSSYTSSSHPSFHVPFLEETGSSGGQWEYRDALPPSDTVSLTDVNSGMVLANYVKMSTNVFLLFFTFSN